MDSKKFFTAPLTFLIVAMLAIFAFPINYFQTRLLAGIFLFAVAWWIYLCAVPRRRKSKLIPMQRRVRRFKISAINRISKRKMAMQQEAKTNVETLVLLLRHANCRISTYLKSAFPEATWEWVSKHPERIIESGDKGRIRLFNIPDYDYADISFDCMARISCDFLRVVSFAELKVAKGDSVQENKQSEQPVDVAVWYNLQGKSALEDCIGNLHSHGYSGLIIKENGDVCTQNVDKEITCVTLRNLPAKNYWPGLVDVLNGRNFTAAIVGDQIAVTW